MLLHEQGTTVHRLVGWAEITQEKTKFRQHLGYLHVSCAVNMGEAAMESLITDPPLFVPPPPPGGRPWCVAADILFLPGQEDEKSRIGRLVWAPDSATRFWWPCED